MYIGAHCEVLNIGKNNIVKLDNTLDGGATFLQSPKV
jgi:hypothetical protein